MNVGFLHQRPKHSIPQHQGIFLEGMAVQDRIFIVLRNNRYVTAHVGIGAYLMYGKPLIDPINP